MGVEPGVLEAMISAALGQCLPQTRSVHVRGLRREVGGALGKGEGEKLERVDWFLGLGCWAATMYEGADGAKPKKLGGRGIPILRNAAV